MEGRREEIIEIEISGYWCRLLSRLPAVTYNGLYRAMSFQPEGYERTDAFLEGRWDGFVGLMRGSSFPVGLLHIALNFFAATGVRWTIDDLRHTTQPKPKPPRIDPRPYQRDIIEEALRQRSGIIQLPTGGGKTVILLSIAGHIGRPALVIVPSRDLVSQIAAEAEKVLGIQMTAIKNNNIISLERPAGLWMGICTWQTIAAAIRNRKEKKEQWAAWERLLGSIDALFVDEAHWWGADKINETTQHIPARFRYGTSATPERTGGDDLRMYAGIGPRIGGLSVSDLIDEGWLTPAVIQFLRIDPVKVTDGRNWQKCYDQGIVLHEDRNRLLAAEAVDMTRGGRVVLVMVDRIRHGEIMQRYLRDDSGMEVPFVNGKTGKKKREAARQGLACGDIPMAISSSIFIEGVDFPMVSGLVMAGPYKSAVRTKQRIGRGLRLAEGKDDCMVIETFDQIPYARQWALERYHLYREERRFEVRT